MDLSELKSPFMEADLRPTDSTGSTVQCHSLSARDCDRTGLGDDSPGKENCLINPQTISKSLPLDFPNAEAQVDQRIPVRAIEEDGDCGVDGHLPVCTQLSASTHPQASLCHTCKPHTFHLHHQSQDSCSSESKTQHSLKTIAAHKQQVASDDLCASLVLACLFCQLEDCLVAMGDGCQLCAGVLCSKMCCCDPSSLDPFLEECPSCDPGSCLEAHCCLCKGPGVDISVCDLCLHTTECLELGMEVSQLLFH